MVKKANRLVRYLTHKQSGFTLIELLVVVAILGALVAVAIPNVGRFINSGKEKSWDTELHDVQTAAIAMLADADPSNGTFEDDYEDVGRGVPFNEVSLTTDEGTFTLDQFLVGIEDDFTSKTGCSYNIAKDGKVTSYYIPGEVAP